MAKKLTTEEFIKRAKAVHGDKYGYDEAVYSSANSKIVVICTKHGKFEQVANDHLRGRGCRKCAGNAPLTLKEFISRAVSVHGKVYDYTLSKIKSVDTVTKIKCKVHGIFEQTPYKHIKGSGCPMCAHNRNITTEEFIKLAQSTHNNLYTYYKASYTRAKNKVVITCPTHGDFEQSPSSHLQGAGCPVCGGSKKLTTKEFIQRAIIVHGAAYNYSKTTYSSSKKKLVIVCKQHGNFDQTPHQHLLGQGCPKCGGTANLTTEEFIEQAKAVHGEKFSYANSKYVNNRTKIEVICEKHGSFFPTPNNHITKMSGCPKCSAVISKGHSEVGAFLESILNG